MDFFARQARERSSSRLMVALFLLAVIAIVASVDVVTWLAWRIGGHHPGHGTLIPHRLFVLVTVMTVGVIAACAIYRAASLSSGGRAVAEGMGASPVPPDSHDVRLRQLRNVIEEVAIASGVRVPDIYVMEGEAGINAFAAGYSPADAAICVTQGCLDQLSRDELQGVIAHEFSHVLNGDMRLNIRLMGMLFGIMALAVIGRQLLGDDDESSWRWRRRSSNDSYGWILGLGLLAVGYVGYFFGRLIQSAVARSRESLADASAVQFTRQTHGLAGALKKIAASADGSTLRAANRHEVAHMLFGDADEPRFFERWFATHPPLMERISELDPAFRESDLIELSMAMDEAAQRALATEAEERPARSTAASRAFTCGEPEARQADMPTTPGIAMIAGLQPVSRQKVPATLLSAARQPDTTLALSLGLAMHGRRDATDTCRRIVANTFGDDVFYAASALAADIDRLSPELRLPLISLVAPSLRTMPDAQRRTVLQTLDTLTRLSDDGSLDSYCLTRLLRLQLIDPAQPQGAAPDQQKKLPACRDSLSLVLSVLAAFGHADERSASRAWMLAMDLAFPGTASRWRMPPPAWREAFEHALTDLDALMPPAKAIVMQCLQRAIQTDGVVSVVEAQLLRLACASLHCPLPPLRQPADAQDITTA